MTGRRLRGGAWNTNPRILRSAKRNRIEPDIRFSLIGFRMTVREAGAGRVFRGGSWFSDARNVRSACRRGYGPGLRGADLGFRVVVRS